VSGARGGGERGVRKERVGIREDGCYGGQGVRVVRKGGRGASATCNGTRNLGGVRAGRGREHRGSKGRIHCGCHSQKCQSQHYVHLPCTTSCNAPTPHSQTPPFSPCPPILQPNGMHAYAPPHAYMHIQTRMYVHAYMHRETVTQQHMPRSAHRATN